MWTRFLLSLETEGGKMVVIIFMLLFLVFVAVLMTMRGYPLQETGRTLLASAVSSLLGILYGYLKAGTTTQAAQSKVDNGTDTNSAR